jgi:hypothetical protein
VNIKLLALDFDLTILDIHTGGNWNSSAHELIPHVRAEMKCVIHRSLERGIHIAVASFSIQEQLIRSVLGGAIAIAHEIIVRGGRNRSEPLGKRKQLEEVVHDINTIHRNANVTPLTTILIDDDLNNVKRALTDGYRSLWFDPDEVNGFFQSIISLSIT